ncbi:hypothetical protein GCM10011519_25020 [Marmoricola endophyticus]|uniref:Uncharacterized protein n=1 Tax=Marmoricola endophyticus TaxID=2040280 RepID=A0A917BM46_9ACTN|nr:hypothetical protein GCM10011519_25020 [Marmoricola endophyticus]
MVLPVLVLGNGFTPLHFFILLVVVLLGLPALLMLAIRKR